MAVPCSKHFMLLTSGHEAALLQNCKDHHKGQVQRHPVKRNLIVLLLVATCFLLTACATRGSCVQGNCRNGPGTMSYPEGGEYKGEWKDGQRHGRGTLTSPYAGHYKGHWKNDKPDGEGTWVFPDGARYQGQWQNGEWSGQGMMTFPNGTRYIGEWKNDVPHGRGKVIYPDGRELIGEFENGKLVGN